MYRSSSPRSSNRPSISRSASGNTHIKSQHKGQVCRTGRVTRRLLSRTVISFSSVVSNPSTHRQSSNEHQFCVLLHYFSVYFYLRIKSSHQDTLVACPLPLLVFSFSSRLPVCVYVRVCACLYVYACQFLCLLHSFTTTILRMGLQPCHQQ